MKSIETGVNYRAWLLDPITLKEHEIGPVTPDADGNWEPPLGNPPWKLLPVYHDWVMVLDARGGSAKTPHGS